MAIVAIALIAACGRGPSSEQLSDIMRNHLTAMRNAIRDFREDKSRPPKSLEELVQAHYLRMMPKDPITGVANWRVITEEPVRVDEFARGVPPPPAAGGIVDVRSSAPGRDAHGKPWSEY